MPKIFFSIIFFITAFTIQSFAQDTLPNISVKNYNGKIVISWKNSYGARITNLNIQRSGDSLKNFTTIATVLNPMNKENGVVDSKAPIPTMFYRVFVAFEGGSYVFSKSHRPVIDTFKASVVVPVPSLEPPKEVSKVIKSAVPPPYIYGRFIYTGKDNNVIINLPDATKHKYSVKFFDDKDKPLFDIKTIPEPYLILDKVNFMHSGWFNYQLLDSGNLKEKYRLFIPKDGR
jgi:hypothetical protein